MHQIMLLESRGCMLGGLAMVPLWLWFMPKTTLNWSAVATALVLGSVLAGPSVVEEFSSSFKPREEMDYSAASRFDLWKAGVAITLDYPLLGVGPWAGQKLVPQYIGLDANRKGLHNVIFEVSTGCGVPALGFYLTFFAIVWWVAVHALRRRQRNPLPEWAEITYLATASGLVGYFVSSMFTSGAALETSYLLVSVALATSLVLRQQRDEAGAQDIEHEELSVVESHPELEAILPARPSGRFLSDV
jgi:O-antigen ligase